MMARTVRSGPSMRVQTNTNTHTHSLSRALSLSLALSLKITWYPIKKSSAVTADAVPSVHFLGRKLNH